MMPEESSVVFREVQRFGLWLRLGVVLAMAFAVGLDCFALWDTLSRQQKPEVVAIVLLILFGILLPIALAILMVVLRLETEIRSDGIYIRFFPLHIDYKRFAPKDLDECYARQYKPLREYGGWGIRYGLGGKGKAYNVSGNKGVQLIFKNGKKLLIGSQRADQLADAIRSIMKEA
jgi:hypothetical protein